MCSSSLDSPEVRRRFLAGLENATFVPDEFLEWVVDSPRHLKGLRVTEVSDRIVNWTPELRRELQLVHERHPQMNYCVKDVSTMTLEEYLSIPVPQPYGSPPRGPLDDESGYIGPVAYPFGARPYRDGSGSGMCGKREWYNHGKDH